jgi:hypothetical protein
MPPLRQAAIPLGASGRERCREFRIEKNVHPDKKCEKNIFF